MDELFEFLCFIVPVFVAIGVFFGGIAATVRMIGHNSDVSACNVFAAESGRETKFVDYSLWDWDCLTPTTDGKWVSAYNLRGNGEA